ncbi:MAG: TatD family hydrolase, partial [Candidatus Nanohaloarchaea archaeon]
VDSHCHLYFDRFNDDREEVIKRAQDKLEYVVNAGSNTKTNKQVLKLKNRYPEFIKANLGLHPTQTDSFNEIEKIKQQIRREQPAAVGEIGLDHYHVKDEEKQREQEKAFRELLQLAEELEKPIVVHSRQAERRAFEIIREFNVPEVMLHCFNGSIELAEEAVKENMKIGVTTQVLDSKHVQKLVENLSVEELLLETDSPFLYPDGRNEPVKVVESAEKIAELKNVEKQRVVEATTRNSRRIFCRD